MTTVRLYIQLNLLPSKSLMGFFASVVTPLVKEVILDSPVQLSDIHEAIRSFKSSKAPGLDGLTGSILVIVLIKLLLMLH